MPVHEDHHGGRGNDDPHLHSLRVALGSILAPKRPQMTRSSTTSGTASPAVHCPHSAIPLSPSHSGSPSHPAPTPVPHGLHLPHHPHTPHHLLPYAHPHATHHQPALPGSAHMHAVHALDEPHPHIPDAVVVPLASSAVPDPGNVTPGGRAHFVETLQSKKSWDALIHGSWM